MIWNTGASPRPDAYINRSNASLKFMGRKLKRPNSISRPETERSHKLESQTANPGRSRTSSRNSLNNETLAGGFFRTERWSLHVPLQCNTWVMGPNSNWSLSTRLQGRRLNFNLIYWWPRSFRARREMSASRATAIKSCLSYIKRVETDDISLRRHLLQQWCVIYNQNYLSFLLIKTMPKCCETAAKAAPLNKLVMALCQAEKLSRESKVRDQWWSLEGFVNEGRDDRTLQRSLWN